LCNCVDYLLSAMRLPAANAVLLLLLTKPLPQEVC